MKVIKKMYEEWKKSPIMLSISIVGIMIGVLGIYLALRENKPAISFEVIREFDVLNLQKNVKDLSIQFKNTDMIKEGLSLTLLRIKIANIGDTNIKKEDFDINTSWKLEIVNGEVRQVTSSTEDAYLKKELEKINIFEGFVELPVLMFDKDKSFILDTLILHKKNTLIKPVMKGKISGMDKFTSVTKTSEKESKLSGFLKLVFQGGVIINIVRFLMYYVGGSICFILLILLFECLTSKKADQTRLSREKNIE